MTGAQKLTLAMGGRWRGKYGKACCPVHTDRTPSLSIRSGGPDGIKVRCFAGCGEADIIQELERRGIWKPAPGEATQYAPEPIKHEPDPRAIAMWAEARVDDGTIVGRYLRGRAITLAVPTTIRVTPNNDMIAALQCPAGKVIAIQLTKLTHDCKRYAETPRLTYGAMGHSAVRLDKACDVLGLAEGIEDAFSAMEIFNIPTWACLGSGRMHSVAIPDSVSKLYIFGDNGAPGHAAAEKAAYAHRGLKRVIHFPPEGYKDFNDLLKARCGRAA